MWNIYSGQNNPVMNWSEGWQQIEVSGYNIKFYWEFNYEDFVLKVMLDEDNKMPSEMLNSLRSSVVKICEQRSWDNGHKTQNRYGTYNSIYKWNFNFKEKGLKAVMKEVDSILDNIYPMLVNI